MSTHRIRNLDLPSPGPHGREAIRALGPPPSEARLGVVLLHGRGGMARDLLKICTRVAPSTALLLAPEAATSTWYPQRFLAPRTTNEPWLGSALGRVEAIGEWLETSGMPPSRTVVVGFSQGACLATEAVARSRWSWAGLVAWTGGLIGSPDESLADPGERHGLQVFLSSGDPDPHVPWSRVEETATAFRKAGASVDLRRYPGRAHTVGPEELEALRDLLRSLGSPGGDDDGEPGSPAPA